MSPVFVSLLDRIAHICDRQRGRERNKSSSGPNGRRLCQTKLSHTQGPLTLGVTPSKIISIFMSGAPKWSSSTKWMYPVKTKVERSPLKSLMHTFNHDFHRRWTLCLVVSSSNSFIRLHHQDKTSVRAFNLKCCLYFTQSYFNAFLEYLDLMSAL